MSDARLAEAIRELVDAARDIPEGRYSWDFRDQSQDLDRAVAEMVDAVREMVREEVSKAALAAVETQDSS